MNVETPTAGLRIVAKSIALFAVYGAFGGFSTTLCGLFMLSMMGTPGFGTPVLVAVLVGAMAAATGVVIGSVHGTIRARTRASWWTMLLGFPVGMSVGLLLSAVLDEVLARQAIFWLVALPTVPAVSLGVGGFWLVEGALATRGRSSWSAVVISVVAAPLLAGVGASALLSFSLALS